MVNRNRPLFSWSDVECRPELERLEMVLKALPDEDLLRALERRRGRGRDDYPIRAMWRADRLPACLGGVVAAGTEAQSGAVGCVRV